MTTYQIAVVIEKDPAGYFGFCPGLQGCDTHGETYEEVLANLKDLFKLIRRSVRGHPPKTRYGD